MIYTASYSLLNWANGITANKTSPHIHSVSYGNDENQQSSRQYMLTCNIAFMKAGVAGKSILFASGDQGVCGREGCGIFKKDLNQISLAVVHILLLLVVLTFTMLA